MAAAESWSHDTATLQSWRSAILSYRPLANLVLYRKETQMTRTPSIKTLAALFNDPKAAKRIFRMTRAQLCELPAVAARVAECYHAPRTYDLRLTALNAIDDGLFGVEAVTVGTEYADYLNTGETYAPTVIYWRGNYRVQSLGDFVETIERNVRRIA
jgi:hypothetical protein